MGWWKGKLPLISEVINKVGGVFEYNKEEMVYGICHYKFGILKATSLTYFSFSSEIWNLTP